MNYLKGLTLSVVCLLFLLSCESLSTVAVETVKPSVDLGQNTERVIFENTTTLSLEVKNSNNVKSIAYKLNEGDWVDISKNLTAGVLKFQITDIPLGKHSVTLSITDSKDNQESFILELSHVEDKSLPVLSIVGEDKQISTTTEYSIKGSVTDNHAVKLLNYQFNDEERRDITQSISEDSFEIKLSLKEGDNKLNIVAFDKANNKVEKNIIITLEKELKDTQDPILAISNGLDRTIGSDSIEIKGDVSDDIGITSLSYILNKQDPKDVTSRISGKSFTFTVNNLTEGPNSLVITATDQVGNVSSQTVSISFEKETLDTTAPKLSISNGKNRSTQSATIEIKGEVSDNIAIKSLSYSLNTSPAKDISSSISQNSFSLKLSSLIEGENKVVFIATDTSGNSASQTVVIRFNKAEPQEPFEPNNSFGAAKNISLNFELEGSVSPDDEDWFIFELKESKSVRLDLANNINLKYSISPVAQGSRGAVQSYGGQAVDFILEAGSYSLRLAAEASSTAYTLSLNASSLADEAIEPNDSFMTATSITLPHNDNYYMHFNDKDWFKFSLTEAQLVNLTLTDANRTSNSFTAMEFRLYSNTNEAITSIIGAYNNKTLSFPLQAGEHYIKLSTSSKQAHPYKLELTSEVILNQFEPNNSIQQAHKLSLGFKSAGLFLDGFNKDTKDLFSFNLLESKQVSIVIKNNSGLYIDRILSNKEGTYIRDLSTAFNDDLAAGDYVISLSSFSTELPIISYELELTEVP